MLLLDVDQEDAVAARAVLVHVCAHMKRSGDENLSSFASFHCKTKSTRVEMSMYIYLHDVYCQGKKILLFTSADLTCFYFDFWF